MKNELDKQFDAAMRNGLKRHEVAYNADDWLLMEDFLDGKGAHTGRKNKGLVYWLNPNYTKIIAVAAMLLATTIYGVDMFYEIAPESTTPVHANANTSEIANQSSSDLTTGTTTRTTVAQAVLEKKEANNSFAPDSDQQTALITSVNQPNDPTTTISNNSYLNTTDRTANKTSARQQLPNTGTTLVQKNTTSGQHVVQTQQLIPNMVLPSNPVGFGKTAINLPYRSPFNEQAAPFYKTDPQSLYSLNQGQNKNLSNTGKQEAYDVIDQYLDVRDNAQTKVNKNIVPQKTLPLLSSKSLEGLALPQDHNRLSLVDLPVSKKSHTNIQVGVQAGTALHFTDLSVELPNSRFLGVTFERIRNKKWAWETGIYLTESNYYTGNLPTGQNPTFFNSSGSNTVETTPQPVASTDESDVYVTNGVIASNTTDYTVRTNSLRKETSGIEIPFLFKRRFRSGKKLQPYISAGISAYLSFKENYVYGGFFEAMPNQVSFNYVEDSSIEGIENMVSINGIFPEYISTPEGFISTAEATFVDINTRGTSFFDTVDDIKDNRQFYWNLGNLRTGIQYRLTKDIAIQVEGQLKASLSRHTFDNNLPADYLPFNKKRVYAAGLQAGLACTL